MITISFLMLGLGLTILDMVLFRFEKLFLKVDPQNIGKNTKKIIEELIKKCSNDNEKKEVEQLRKKYELFEKSNIIVVGDIILGMRIINEMKEKYIL
jgi:hypothetical protein